MKDLSRYEDITTFDTPPYKKRKRRFGDRKPAAARPAERTPRTPREGGAK